MPWLVGSQCPIPSYGQMIFRQVNRPRIFRPFISRWMFESFPPFGDCEQCWCERSCARVCVDMRFRCSGMRRLGGGLRAMGGLRVRPPEELQTVAQSGCPASTLVSFKSTLHRAAGVIFKNKLQILFLPPFKIL